MSNDDLRFTPPEPKIGSHARFSARRLFDGDVVTDAIIDNGESAPPKLRKFHTLDELRGFIGVPMGPVGRAGAQSAVQPLSGPRQIFAEALET